nr:DNA gyrase subunit A [Cryptomonas sp.]
MVEKIRNLNFISAASFFFIKNKFSKISNSKKKFIIGYSKKQSLTIIMSYKNDNYRDMMHGSNIGKVITIDLHSEMSRSYMEYAMSVIYGRALPDVRDGFKPVHRRILYAMNELGLSPEMPFRKCARVVGEVLGKYHPHGDSAVYEALVRMAQDFSMRSVLVLGHGNFGSIDHDPAAAMRYTECKISYLAKDLILKDINNRITNFITNFDGSCNEPSVLPTRLPTILLNGSNGIAVGMATNIPPHNLTEIIRSLVKLIDDPDFAENKLIKIIPAPDFPTGGSIIGLQGCSKLYKTGQGSIIVRGKTHFESIQTSNRLQKIAIIISEIPYQVNKSALLTKIAELVNDKIIEGITDLRDESDRDGIRIVIELKKDTSRESVLNFLFKKTPLQNNIGSHFLALVGHQPFTLSLRELLLLFIQFRRHTIRRSLQFELTNSIEKNHLINGLGFTSKYIEFVLSVIQKSFSSFEAKLTLMESGLTQIQSDSILSIQLKKLTKLETTKLKEENIQLQNSIEKFKKNLVLPSKINLIMKEELNEIVNIYGMPRRTNVIFSETNGSIDEIEMIGNFPTVIIVTKFYIKRLIIETFQFQARNNRSKRNLFIQEDDCISHFFSCNNHDTILCISKTGIAFAFRAFHIPISKRNTRGAKLSLVLPNIELGDITSMISIPDFYSTEYLILLTKKGMIKKTSIRTFKSVGIRGLAVSRINKDDELYWVKKCYEIDSILISTKKGRVLRFCANDIQLKATGRNSTGKNAITIEKNDRIVDMDILPFQSSPEIFILAITALGYGKRILCCDFKIQSRGGKGILAIKLRNSYTDQLISIKCCNSDQEFLLSSKKGTIIRQRINSIAIQGRTAMGVVVQKLMGDDVISKVLIIPKNLTKIC